MIAVIDYGMGNLRSVQKALEAVGLEATVTSNKKKLKDAAAIVLPGVGAFADCMANLRERDLIEPILRSIETGKPYLGLCLGLQILLDYSEEFGRRKGLGLIPGKVVRFPEGLTDERGDRLKVPHMGWNTVSIQKRNPLFKGIQTRSHFYFVHSYYADCADPADISAVVNYGLDFTVCIRRDNIYACQFHPEKSQKLGLKLLANFGGLLK